MFNPLRILKPQHHRSTTPSLIPQNRTFPGIALSLLVMVGPLSAIQPVTVRWNPNAETDVAGYTVLVGTNSSHYEQSHTVTDSTSLVLEGLHPGTDYYVAVQAYNFAGQTSGLSEEIRFTTAISGTGSLDEWLAAEGASGSAAEDPDHDGLSHLEEFAYGLAPTAADAGFAGLLENGQVRRGSPTISLQGALYCRRVDAISSGLAYQPQFSRNLLQWEPSPDAGTVLASDGEIDLMRIPLPESPDDSMFFRLELRLAP